MALYEHVFLSRQDMTQQQVDQLTEQFKTLIEGHSGKVAKVEQWGLRPLAYRMQKNRKAYYTLLHIDAPVAAMTELERQQGLNENILRFLTLRAEELSDAPSPMLARRDKDDRFRDREDDRPRRPRRPRADSRPADHSAHKGE